MNRLDTLPIEILDYIYEYVHILNFKNTIQIIAKVSKYKRQKYDDLLFRMFFKSNMNNKELQSSNFYNDWSNLKFSFKSELHFNKYFKVKMFSR